MQLTLERNEKHIGSQEIIRCRGCEKTIVRNKDATALKEDEYFYCSDCQRNLQRETLWMNGIKVRKMQIKSVY